MMTAIGISLFTWWSVRAACLILVVNTMVLSVQIQSKVTSYSSIADQKVSNASTDHSTLTMMLEALKRLESDIVTNASSTALDAANAMSILGAYHWPLSTPLNTTANSSAYIHSTNISTNLSASTSSPNVNTTNSSSSYTGNLTNLTDAARNSSSNITLLSAFPSAISPVTINNQPTSNSSNTSLPDSFLNLTTLLSPVVDTAYDPPDGWKYDDDSFVTPMNLPRAKALSQDLLSLIYNRYELGGPVGSQFFRTINNIGGEIWDIMKLKFAKKAVTGNQTFLMIFSGSSVTAGHDNKFHQSYPMVFKRRTQAIFGAMAQGANDCNPYDFCYESMGGKDPDWLGWEQSYNCGHDEAMFELTARHAGWSRNRAVVYFSASGGWSPSKCPKSNETVRPFCDENWNETDANLTRWLPTKEDLAREKSALDSFYKKNPSVARFMGSWGKGKPYSGVAPHGFNVWEGNPLCKIPDKDGKLKSGCNGIDAAQGCKLRFMRKEASVYGNGHGAAHHPPRAIHMMRGEAISWLYVMAMLDAVYMLEEDLKSKSKSDLIAEYDKRLAALQPEIPVQPKKCGKVRCEKQMKCYTDFEPHYPRDMTLKDLIVNGSHWRHVGTAKGPRGKEKYLDHKPEYVGSIPSAGDMSLQINISNTKEVWLYGKMKSATIYLDVNVSVPRSAGKPVYYTPSMHRLLWNRTTQVGENSLRVTDLPPGPHVLSLNRATLTHVITFP